MSRTVTVGSTDQSIRFWAYDSSGSVVTGEAYNSAGMAISIVVRSAGRIVSTTALTLVARSGVGVHTDSALTEVGNGEYVVDLPDSYSATDNRSISLTVSSTAITGSVLVETITVGYCVNVTQIEGSTLGTHGIGQFPADVRDWGGLGATIAIDADNSAPSVAVSHIHDDVISAAAVSAAAVTKIQNGIATASELLLVKDRVSYCLTVLVGACSDAGTSAETYVHSIGGETFTVDYTGLDLTGNRTTTTLSKV